jgi:hypothetical protein
MKMLREFAAPLALAAAAAFAPPAFADSVLDFKLENRTGYTLKEVYISPSKKDNWGKVVNKNPIKDGGHMNVKWKSAATSQSYDLKAVYADGAGSPVWYDLDPTKFSTLTLKWDKEKKKTVAVKAR